MKITLGGLKAFGIIYPQKDKWFFAIALERCSCPTKRHLYFRFCIMKLKDYVQAGKDINSNDYKGFFISKHFGKYEDEK